MLLNLNAFLLVSDVGLTAVENNFVYLSTSVLHPLRANTRHQHESGRYFALRFQSVFSVLQSAAARCWQLLTQHLKRQTKDGCIRNAGWMWRGYIEFTLLWGLRAARKAQRSFSNLVLASSISQPVPRATANGSAEAGHSDLLKSFEIALPEFHVDSEPGGIFHSLSSFPHKNSPTFF